MAHWADLERDEPALAEAGKRRLVGADGVAIGYLATVSAEGKCNIAPVCPVFCRENVYLIAGAHTPKASDLRNVGEYALHAFLGDNDEEFQFAGRAALAEDRDEIEAVHEAVPFAAFSRTDPVFRLDMRRALWAYWERAGQPDTKQVKRTWRERK